jgi:hypothetical protein
MSVDTIPDDQIPPVAEVPCRRLPSPRAVPLTAAPRAPPRSADSSSSAVDLAELRILHLNFVCPKSRPMVIIKNARCLIALHSDPC